MAYGLIRFAMMLPLNHTCSSLLGRKLSLQLLIVKMKLMLRDSGGNTKVPFLMSGFSTPMHLRSYHNSTIPSIYRHHEQEKKREYGDHVREVEKASFTPLVFATTGAMGREATVFYRRLADLLSHKSNMIYATILAWIRCTLSFSLLWSAAVCIHGSRSISYRSIDASPEVGLAESPRDY